MIFETHAHYDDGRFDEDREQLLNSLKEAGVGPVINIGASLESTKQTMELAEAYDFVYAAVGVHPSEIHELNEESFQWITSLANHPKTVAIGEIGLDYYWDKEEEVQANQRYWFKRQLQLARETKLPVVIHSRDAGADTLAILKEEKAQEIPGVIHCYSYSKELALEFVKMGFCIGIGGVLTFKNARKLVETVEAIPLERILLETDCPYMAPEPYRGKRNSSLYLPYVVEKIAEIKGITTEEVERITWENATKLFTKVNV
ncbi:MAG: TatD family hydrolase [Agathobacter sp.]|nr:TatD family hydrolase [Agathobacter sp.]